MRRVLFFIAMGFLLLGVGGANSAHSATTATSLATGWNHVCYIGAQGSVGEALGSVAPSVQAVYRFGAGGALDRWFPGRPEVSTISTLAPQDSLLMLIGRRRNGPRPAKRPRRTADDGSRLELHLL
jgi:hypothetical protein